MVVEESHYFDRDYLDEFAAYCSRVAHPTSNQCRRIHFFDQELTTRQLRAALNGSVAERGRLEKSYLGFTVLRPLAHAPLGRSVVKWYPDDLPRYKGNPRITSASREYRVHLAGLTLRVVGIAWQQQDGAVALCATTALWSMLHSSAFDDHHAIPSTAEVTRLAYESLRRGVHVFPASDGLEVRQIVEAIARARLTPLVMEGNLRDRGFTREKFAACAVMLRSGFPVLISGNLKDRGGHVVCATGFREVGPGGSEGIVLQDSNVETLYAHDDNLGPNVRIKVHEAKKTGRISLKPAPPQQRYHGRRLTDPVENYPEFVPEHLIVGVHEELHMTPDELNRIAMIITANLRAQVVRPKLAITATARFVRVAQYLDTVLATPFGPPGTESSTLGTLRESIAAEWAPMSLYVGVVRVGYGPAPVADVLIDTSDRPHLDTSNGRVLRWQAFGTVIFAPEFAPAFASLAESLPFGQRLVAALGRSGGPRPRGEPPGDELDRAGHRP